MYQVVTASLVAQLAREIPLLLLCRDKFVELVGRAILCLHEGVATYLVRTSIEDIADVLGFDKHLHRTLILVGDNLAGIALLHIVLELAIGDITGKRTRKDCIVASHKKP